MSQSLADMLKALPREAVAKVAHEEQRAYERKHREAIGHQRTADAARKELKRRGACS